jgi:uncharacterized protein DUF6908
MKRARYWSPRRMRCPRNYQPKPPPIYTVKMTFTEDRKIHRYRQQLPLDQVRQWAAEWAAMDHVTGVRIFQGNRLLETLKEPMKRYNPLATAHLHTKLLPSERLGVPPTCPDVDLKVAACETKARRAASGNPRTIAGLRIGAVAGLRNGTVAFMLGQEATALDPSAPLANPGDVETAKALLLAYWNQHPDLTDWRDAWSGLQKVTFSSREPKPLARLRHHVTGAIERGEASAVVAVAPAPARAIFREGGEVAQGCFIIGNFDRKKDAEVCASTYVVAKVRPYLSGKHKSGWLVVMPEAKFEVWKAGDKVTFHPYPARKKSQGGRVDVTGTVRDRITNTSGAIGYHIHAPVGNDVNRIVRVWLADGWLQVIERFTPEPEPKIPSLAHSYPADVRCKAFAGRIRQVAARAGRLDDFEAALRSMGAGEFQLSVEREGFLRLVIEILPAAMCPAGVPAVSVAHYGEQNGDPMRDPEIVFACISLTEWVPYEITQDYTATYRNAFVEDRFYPSASRHMIELVNVWGKNLKEQGFCDAPEPDEPAPKGTFTIGGASAAVLEKLSPTPTSQAPRKIVPADVFQAAVAQIPPPLPPPPKTETALERLLRVSIPAKKL